MVTCGSIFGQLDPCKTHDTVASSKLGVLKYSIQCIKYTLHDAVAINIAMATWMLLITWMHVTDN